MAKKLTNKNPFDRKAQPLFIKAYKLISKGLELYERAILIQALSKRKGDGRRRKRN